MTKVKKSKSMLRRSLVLFGTAIFAIVQAAEAGASVNSYRYFLTTRSCTTMDFAEPVSSSTPFRYDVQTDAAGRISGITHYWNGMAISETQYTSYSPAGYPTALTGYSDGTAVAKATIDRDSAGCAIKDSLYTLDGKLTAYTTYKYTPGTTETNSFTADGQLTARETGFYDASGVLVRTLSYENPSDTGHWRELIIAPSTGLLTEDRQYDGGHFTRKLIPKYDANGIIVHSDGYGFDGRLYVTHDYENGFIVKKNYIFDDGSTRTVTIANDRFGHVVGAEQRDNGILHAKFSVERFSDYVVKRTLVYAPDGSALAEFPNVLVIECRRNGTVPGEYKGTLYKPPPWW